MWPGDEHGVFWLEPLWRRRYRADQLVTGAYWHNEYAEWVLGRVTEALLNDARIPVFMSH